MPHRRFLVFAASLVLSLLRFSAPRATAQLTTIYEEPNGDWYSCSVSGLKGMGKDCGISYDEMVFTATILSIHPAADDELRLTLGPETVFKGAPAVGMEILTAQRRCLGEMKTGDHWLFSVYRDRESKELLVNFGSRSGPVDAMADQLAFLHKLAALNGTGIVKGRAYLKRESGDGSAEDVPRSNHAVILTRTETGKQLKALTDKDGNFQFEPLPAGEYDLDPNTEHGLWTMWSGTIKVKPNGCTDFDLDFHVDGQISGRLIFPAGVDPFQWEVKASPVDDPGIVPASDWTDKSGGFVLHGLRSGNYLVVVEKTDMRDGPNLTLDLYAPGTPERTIAREIKLGSAARVDGIEIKIPRSAFE
jgi:hypothetical protein